jgi:hypothetical protein
MINNTGQLSFIFQYFKIPEDAEKKTIIKECDPEEEDQESASSSYGCNSGSMKFANYSIRPRGKNSSIESYDLCDLRDCELMDTSDK